MNCINFLNIIYMIQYDFCVGNYKLSIGGYKQAIYPIQAICFTIKKPGIKTDAG